jgi:hypothetical protein
VIAAPLFVILLALATSYVSARGFLLAWRARRILARLGPFSSAVEERGGAPVLLRGVLGGGEIATGFGGSVRAIEDAHVRAASLALPAHLWVRVDGRDVALAGPVQVILGSVEEQQDIAGETASVRRVLPGDVVLVEGVIKSVSAREGDAGYRDRAVAHELVPVPDATWSAHPITVYSARSRHAVAYALLGLLSLGAGTGACLFARARIEQAGRKAERSPPRPACAAPIAALLDRDQPFEAKALVSSCDDGFSRAEVAWMLGDVNEAASEYRAYRAGHASTPLSVSEVEAVTMYDAVAGGDMVRLLKAEWYKGPADSAQALLDCIISRLRDGSGIVCIDDRWSWQYSHGSYESVHGQPNYALHEPFAYVRFLPIIFGARECGSMFEQLDRFAALRCEENTGVGRALFDAIVGSAATDGELQRVDRLYGVMTDVARHSPHLPPGDPRAQDFADELGRDVFDAERALAVAAAAAWYAHDEARFEKYLPYIEAHAKSVFTEHLALVRGLKKVPDASHSPSDYSDLDMTMFGMADSATPDAFVAKLRERSFSSPARLEELLTSRPQHRAKFAEWVKSGFVPRCRICGVYALLDGTFRRREAARIAGERDLEAKFAVIQQKLGEALTRPASWGPVLSLESLLARK